MPITRQSPVMDMDTNQPLNMGPRASRLLLHRMLRAHGITHDVADTRDALLAICQRNNVQGFPAVPRETAQASARATEPVPVPDAQHFPRNVVHLRKLCKERGLKWERTDKRDDLVARIQADIVEKGYG